MHAVELQVKEVCGYQKLKRNLWRDFELGHWFRGAVQPRVASETTWQRSLRYVDVPVDELQLVLHELDDHSQRV